MTMRRLVLLAALAVPAVAGAQGGPTFLATAHTIIASVLLVELPPARVYCEMVFVPRLFA